MRSGLHYVAEGAVSKEAVPDRFHTDSPGREACVVERKRTMSGILETAFRDRCARHRLFLALSAASGFLFGATGTGLLTASAALGGGGASRCQDGTGEQGCNAQTRNKGLQLVLVHIAASFHER